MISSVQPVMGPGTLPLRGMVHPILPGPGGESSDEPISTVPRRPPHSLANERWRRRRRQRAHQLLTGQHGPVARLNTIYIALVHLDFPRGPERHKMARRIWKAHQLQLQTEDRLQLRKAHCRGGPHRHGASAPLRCTLPAVTISDGPHRAQPAAHAVCSPQARRHGADLANTSADDRRTSSARFLVRCPQCSAQFTHTVPHSTSGANPSHRFGRTRRLSF